MNQYYLERLPIPVSCSPVNNYNKKSGIQLRRFVLDKETIKQIIWCAEHQTPILVLPVFSNRMYVLAHCAKHGLIKYNKETKKYYLE